MSTTVSIEPLTLTTADGIDLAALWVRGSAPRAAVSLHGATAVKKEFYLHFSTHLAQQGYAVLLFDYRGVGGSRPKRLRGYRAHMRQWGELDMPAALDHVAKTYPHLPRVIVGHSMGGQLVGLMPNHRLADALLLVSASTAYWRDLSFAYGLYTAAIWYALVPLTTLLLGYLPLKRLRLGEDLPAGVAREWAAWCTSAGYLPSFVGKTIARTYFGEIARPIRAYVLDDDPIATRRTVPQLLSYFSKAKIDLVDVHDHAQGAPGHFGFFSRRFSSVWEGAVDWLNHQVAKTSSRTALDTPLVAASSL